MTDTVDPEVFFAAASDLYRLGEKLHSSYSTAAGGLSGTGQMAGTDERGTEFSQAYDPLVADVISIGSDLIDAIFHYGSVLRQAGINHAKADADSDLRGGIPDEAPGEESAPFAVCYNVPLSEGGSLEGLLEDIGLNDYLDIPVPDGDTEKLKTAINVWSTFGDSINSELVGEFTAIANSFSDLSGEDIDFIIEDLNDLEDGIVQYQESVSELAEAALGHKEYLDEVRAQLEGILKDLALELGTTAAIGIASSFVTFGAGGALAAGRVGMVVAKFARRISTAVKTVLGIKKAKIAPGMARRLKQAGLNEKLIQIKRMEVRDATSTAARNQRKGQLGELKAGIDPKKPKERVPVNGRTRIPDDIDELAREVVEVKNVKTLSLSEQIKDSIQIAEELGFKFRLIIDDNTKIYGPLKELADKGEIIIQRMDLN